MIMKNINKKGTRYYEENKKIANKACDWHRGLPEEKIRQKEYARNSYHNMSEKARQKLIEHKKNWIHGISQEELQQRLWQRIEQMKKALQKLIS